MGREAVTGVAPGLQNLEIGVRLPLSVRCSTGCKLSTVDEASERWVSGLTHNQAMSGSSPELATCLNHIL